MKRFVRAQPKVVMESLPMEFINLFRRRVSDLIFYYGYHIKDVSLETFAASCYNQGLIDMAQMYENKGQTLNPPVALPAMEPPVQVEYAP